MAFFHVFFIYMLMMGKRRNMGVMRGIIISKDHGMAFIHILIAIFNLLAHIRIFDFHKLKSSVIVKRNYASDKALFRIVDLLTECI